MTDRRSQRGSDRRPITWRAVQLLAVIAALMMTTGALHPVKADPERQHLRIATEGAYAPFNSVDTSGRAVGFDLDIASEICVRLNADCTVDIVDWDGLIPALIMGKTDMIVASVSITDARKKRVLFSRPYYYNTYHFVARDDLDLAHDRKGLRGCRIGAQRGTRSSLWLDANVGADGTALLYDTPNEALRDLAAGRLDLVLGDTYPIFRWLQSDEGRGFALMGPPVIRDDEIGIVLRKEDHDLKAQVDQAINDMIADGTYRTINNAWFPFDLLEGF